MRRTVTILTTFLILWTSAVYAVNPNETSATQGLYENENGPGGNGPGRSPAIKGPDISPAMIQEDKNIQQDQMVPDISKTNTIVFDENEIQQLLSKHQNKEDLTEQEWEQLNAYWAQQLPPRQPDLQSRNNNRAALIEGFEDATFPPLSWLAVSNNTSNSITQSSSQAHSGVYSARFSSYSSATDYNQYLITPTLTVATGDSITFWHYKHYSWASDQISVGISTTDTEIASFTFGSALTSTNAWARHAEDLSAYVGQEIYVAINYYGAYQYYLYVDDFAGPEATISSPGLFFSEWIEGTSYNKALELYNPTSDTIWLDNYAFPNVSNAPTTPGEYEYWNTFDAGAYVLPGEVFVLAHPSADAAMLQAANMTSFSYFSNGDDGFGLVTGGVWVDADADGSVDAGEMTGFTVLDWIGDWEGDPGTGWDVAGVSAATANHTILRDAGTLWGNTDWTSSAGDASASEWTVYDQNYFDNLGGYPDDPCFDSLTTVTVVAQSYGSEKNFMVQDASGDTLLSCFGCMGSYTTFTEDICLTDGLYSFLAKDGWGDGWDGATFTITDAAGNVLAAGTGPTSADGTSWIEYPFAIGIMLPIVSGLGDLDFAGNILGAAAEESMQIINTGMGDFEVTGITVAGDAFASTTTALTVVPGDTGYIDFTYTPSDEDGDEGSVVIAHNASSDGSAVTDTFALSGYGVDALFYEDFGPWTGSNTVLPMSGWTILDNNGDATTIPEKYKTFYHDQYGLDHDTELYTYGNGAMTAYIGSGNSYHANETLITPQIDVSVASKVTFWMYNNYDRGYELDVSYSTDGVTYTALGSYHITNVYTQHSAILPETGNQYIAFTFAPDSGGLYTYFNFDEVAISALPNTHVTGFVTDSETGDDIAGATVEFGGATDVSDFDGYYWVNGAEPGMYPLTVSADGYLDSYFTLEIDIGDTLYQNVGLVSESSAGSEVYATSFDSGDDMGWTFTGGTNPFELSAGFWFDEDYYYYDDSITVTPFNGDSMMVCSPTGYDNNEFSWWMNLTATDMDLSGYSSAELTLQMNYWTEEGWDFVYLLATMPELYGGSYFYLDVNGDGVGNAADGISGFSDGWVEVNADLSGWTGTEYGVEIAVLFVADASVPYGFGVAIDDVVVNGFSEPRPWVEDLTAESFVNDQIHLMWSDPTGGQRTMATSTITMNRTPIEVDPRNPRKAFEYETGEEEITINIPEGYSRDLVSYNVFRTDDFYFAGYDGFDFIANIAIDSYTDTNVDNDKLYYYFVTAVYDEGESLGSGWAAAGAGEVTDVAMEDLAVDFNDSTFGLWSTIVGADNGWDVGTTNTGTYGVPTPSDSSYYAYINDDAVGSAYTSEGWLTSPFFNLGDADHAAITFNYFNGYSTQTLNLWAWIGWDTWIYVGELPVNSASGWQTVSMDLADLAGIDHVRLYAYYTDNGTWAGSVAIDNISVSTWDGPTNLTLAETTESVTLHWTGLGGRAAGSRVNEYPDGVSEAEKLLASDLNDIRNPGQIGQHGEDNFSRVQGDSIGNPFVIDALPFSITGSTVGFTDDYNEVCPYSTSAADVVYQLTLGTLENPLIVDLCESYYDTKVYIYSESDTTNPIACSDDYCTASHGQAWTSYMEISPELLPPGIYYIVVDGYNAASEGDYVMDVYESDPPPPAMDVMYNVYRDGNLLAAGLADSVTSYLDETATLNDACYEVTSLVRTLGVDGDTLYYVETGASNEACGSVVNQPPGEFILLTPADGDTVMITPDNIGSSQIFAWNASVDPNGTPVEYEICFAIQAPFDQFCEDNGNSTAHFVPFADVAYYIDSLYQAGGNVVLDINWTVYANDGMDETEAINGPRSITFDAGWALGIDDDLLPEVFALHQNYPNPFNPVTTIRFDVPEESHIRLDVYNILGQRVQTLVNGNMQPGFHVIRWNGTNDTGTPLASGMYIYRIHSSKFTAVKKLVLMK